MLTATLKSLASRKLRLVLSGLAVVLGVMAVSGALVATETIGRSFDQLFATITEGVSVQVTGAQHVADGERGGEPVTEPVHAELVDTVTAVPGVARAQGVIDVAGARVVGRDGKVIVSGGPPPFGAAWRGEIGLVQLRSGRGPQAADEVAINAGLATAGGFTAGDRIEVLTLQPKRAFTVVGIFGYRGDRDSLGGESRVAFTEPVAAELMLGQTGVYSAIDLTAKDGVSAEQLRDDVAAALGAGYRVRTGEQLAAEQAAATGEFVTIIRQVLLGFAGVALFVGVFLILNTFSILVAQRTAELALFRSLGASRGQLIGSVLIEAVLIGLIASTIGFGAGLGVAALLKTVMQAVSGATLPGALLTVPPSAVVAAYLVGVLVTVAAALMPALRASRIPPVAAMREAASGDRPVTALTVAGGVNTGAGAAVIGAALVAELGSWTLWTLLGGVLVAFLGIAMLTPSISRPAVSLLGRALPPSVPTLLGRRNSARNPRRTAITAAALMIGIGLVTGVSVLASSMRASLQDAVRTDLRAELVIAGPGAGRASASYDPTVIDRAAELPGVARAVAVRSDIAQAGAQAVPVTAGDVTGLAAVFGLQPVSGQLRQLRSGEVVVDDAFAAERALAVGDELTLATQRGGPGRFTVVGIYRATSLLPSPVLSVPDAAAQFRTPQASQGFLQLTEDADAATVREQVAALLADNPEVSVQDQSSFTEQQAGQVDVLLTALYVMLGLTVVIAVLGVVNTLALSVLERTRELGLLRAVGMRRGQVVGMITAESVVISVFGALLGVGVGLGLGAAIVRALGEQGITELTLPWTTLGLFLALAVLIGLLAAVAPAVRAARVDVLRAIAYQ